MKEYIIALKLFNNKIYLWQKLLHLFNRFTDENKKKRPEYSFAPFGIGPRHCIGMRLALLEAKMALVSMIQNFTFAPCEKTEVSKFNQAAWPALH